MPARLHFDNFLVLKVRGVRDKCQCDGSPQSRHECTRMSKWMVRNVDRIQLCYGRSKHGLPLLHLIILQGTGIFHNLCIFGSLCKQITMVFDTNLHTYHSNFSIQPPEPRAAAKPCPVPAPAWRTFGPLPSSSATAAAAPATTLPTSSPSGSPPSTGAASSASQSLKP